MRLTITDDRMTAEHSRHYAEQIVGVDGWRVSWLRGRTLTRNEAITALSLADVVAEQVLTSDHLRWPLIDTWAAELGLTGPRAVVLIGEPDEPGSDADNERFTTGGESTTVRRLTPSNIDALRRMLRADEAELVDVGATVATFRMPALDAVRLVQRLHTRARAEYGGGGHPSRSLPAVIRKLRDLAGDR